MQKWLYKKDEEPTLFKSEDEINKAVKDGWVDTPAKFNNKNVTKPSKALGFDELDRDELYEIAKNKGLNVPSNVGKKKLIERLSELKE